MGISVNSIKSFIVTEFVPDATAEQLDNDYDLLDTGVVDSLGLLRLIEWVSEQFALPIDDLDLSPENFRSVNAIREFVEAARAVRLAPS
ncbi:MAG TPA: acyl carrier protein [Pseudonocardiaceae bacterium]|nr:acyl carrier protein [Pseudonocardiaceae bacterium]